MPADSSAAASNAIPGSGLDTVHADTVPHTTMPDEYTLHDMHEHNLRMRCLELTYKIMKENGNRLNEEDIIEDTRMYFKFVTTGEYDEDY